MIIKYFDDDYSVCEIDTKEYVVLLDESINHYKKMIKWARKQDPEERMSLPVMLKAIGTDWFGYSCNLCNRFKGCRGCPIYENNNNRRHCQGTPWVDLNSVDNWKGWLIHAKEELELLTRLKNQYKSM